MQTAFHLIFDLCITTFRVGQIGIFSQSNDVYSFGVFLLELVTGQEASHIDSFGSNERILQWVCKNSFNYRFILYKGLFFWFYIPNFLVGIYLKEERIRENLRNIGNNLITLKLIIATKLTENLYTSSAEENTQMIKSLLVL